MLRQPADTLTMQHQEVEVELSDKGSLGMTFDFNAHVTNQINQVFSVKGQAAKAGLQAGDIVIAIAGQRVDENISPAVFTQRLMDEARPLNVRVRRRVMGPPPSGYFKSI